MSVFRFLVQSASWKSLCWSSGLHEVPSHSRWRSWRSMFLKCTSVLFVALQQKISSSFMNTFLSINLMAPRTSAGNVDSATHLTCPSPDISLLYISWRSLSQCQNKMGLGRIISKKINQIMRMNHLTIQHQTEDVKFVRRLLKLKRP